MYIILCTILLTVPGVYLYSQAYALVKVDGGVGPPCRHVKDFSWTLHTLYRLGGGGEGREEEGVEGEGREGGGRGGG